ncbi:hypothetical protein FMM80_00840 [Schaedlerella arabinosiphila]|uniref:Uncharacterized protein n=1 Tax=Schaedlerella arabinosiphila TaxID=2044587 RepID=A0A9X5C3T1_9FIRM|nr:hypothetical protein [Schaedlerella arabinosiphila]KAI4438962.1 hypothetical protein C824_001448 [Schaedlerella arabinosiphila]NDO67354.1 hypothetical protein [Schaedlerella arabinosiphila]
MAKHGIAESTKLHGCMNISFVATEDVDNGSIVANGGLADGHTDVYSAKKPTKEDKVYIVIHSVYGYDERLEEEKNEDNYTNKAGRIFRTYELKSDRKFRVSSDMITPVDDSTPVEPGQYVVANGSYKMSAVTAEPTDAKFVGIVETVEETGFPYFGSSKGVKTSEMGYVFDTRIVKVKIRVIKND